MAFRYEKLYTDLITDGGDVAIAYVTQLRWLGLAQWSCGLEWYSREGTREVFQSRKAPSEHPGKHGHEAYSFALESPAHTAELHVEVELPSWRPQGDAPIEGIQWSTRASRARVRLHRDGALLGAGLGYSDWVVLTRMPRALPLRTLLWGRLHLESSSLIYTQLHYQDGDTWTRLGLWDQGGFREAEDLEIEASEDGFSLQSSQGQGALRPLRILHQGDAIDKSRFPSWIERLLSRWISGPMTETRWLSQAQWQGEAGWALHERVDFGT